MIEMLRKIPVGFTGILAVMLGLAPVFPEPHLVQKLRMLFSGELTKLIDIGDLLMHGGPAILFVGLVVLNVTHKPEDDASETSDESTQT